MEVLLSTFNAIFGKCKRKAIQYRSLWVQGAYLLFSKQGHLLLESEKYLRQARLMTDKVFLINMTAKVKCSRLIGCHSLIE